MQSRCPEKKEGINLAVGSEIDTVQPEHDNKTIFNMKLVIAFTALVAVALAAPQHNDRDAYVVRNELDNIGVDGYNFAYETSNGISAQEQGQLTNAGTDNEAIAVRGSFQYVGPDGVTYTVNYVADENGFQPQGAHIPQ